MQADVQENQNSAIPVGESRASGPVSTHQALRIAAAVWEGYDVRGRCQVLQMVLLRSWLDYRLSVNKIKDVT